MLFHDGKITLLKVKNVMIFSIPKRTGVHGSPFIKPGQAISDSLSQKPNKSGNWYLIDTILWFGRQRLGLV